MHGLLYVTFIAPFNTKKNEKIAMMKSQCISICCALCLIHPCIHRKVKDTAVAFDSSSPASVCSAVDAYLIQRWKLSILLMVDPLQELTRFSVHDAQKCVSILSMIEQ